MFTMWVTCSEGLRSHLQDEGGIQDTVQNQVKTKMKRVHLKSLPWMSILWRWSAPSISHDCVTGCWMQDGRDFLVKVVWLDMVPVNPVSRIDGFKILRSGLGSWVGAGLKRKLCKQLSCDLSPSTVQTELGHTNSAIPTHVWTWWQMASDTMPTFEILGCSLSTTPVAWTTCMNQTLCDGQPGRSWGWVQTDEQPEWQETCLVGTGREMQIKRSGGRRTEERGKRKWELEKERGHKARTGRYTKCSLGKSMLVNCDHWAGRSWFCYKVPTPVPVLSLWDREK